jgi:FKBP-type peptidyl-prolyl cis-trans isomerase
MKKGEIAQLLISPDYAYGEMGVVPRIPPKATSK